MLKNIKLGIKISGGFILVLLLLVVVAYMGYNGLSGVKKSVTPALSFYDLTYDLDEARLKALNYVRSQDNDTATAAQEALKAILNETNEAITKISKKEYQNQANESIKKVENYSTMLKSYIESVEKKSALFTQMRTAAETLQGKLDSASSDKKYDALSDKLYEALESLSSVRLATVYYDKTNGLKSYKDKIDTGIPKIQSLIKEMKNASGSSIFDEMGNAMTSYSEGISQFSSALESQQQMVSQMTATGKEANELFLSLVTELRADATNKMAGAVKFIITCAILAIIIGILASYFITRSITVPLSVGVDVADKMSKGILMDNINVEGKDETAMLLSAMEKMVTSLKGTVKVAEKMAQGDLNVKVDLLSDQDLLGLSLNSMIEKFNSVVMDVKLAADNVASGSQELSSSSEEMSQGATEQSASAEEASSSMEQMSANIKQNADNAQQTERIAVQAAEDAEKGGKAVQETVGAMKQIAEKISIIEEIARQTNMLALNAAI